MIRHAILFLLVLGCALGDISIAKAAPIPGVPTVQFQSGPDVQDLMQNTPEQPAKLQRKGKNKKTASKSAAKKIPGKAKAAARHTPAPAPNTMNGGIGAVGGIGPVGAPTP